MKKEKKNPLTILSHLYAVLIYVFFYVPVLVMVVFSFNDKRNNVVWAGFTTKWYVRLFSDTDIWKIFGNTFLIAVVSTVLAVVLGTTGAVGLKNAAFKGKSLVVNSLYFPIVIPEIVLAVATYMLFNMSDISLSIGTMIAGNATLVLPYVYITVKARLVGMDPSIEEASLDLGVDRFHTFLNITLPEIMPGVVSGALMAFSLALDDLIISSFLADANTTTLPIKVYSMLKKGISPEINALTSIILFVFLAGLALMQICGAVQKRKEKRKTAHESRTDFSM